MGNIQGRIADPREKDWPLLALFFLMALAYSLMCLFRHWHFESSGYDLGIFDQMIWHYSRFERACGTVNPFNNMLGDHFSPLLMILAPLYWIFSRVETLLVAQAFLLMLSMFPIFYFAKNKLGRLSAYCFTLSFAIFWGIQYTAQYDFHEVSFAVPLVAFAIYFFSENKRGWFWISVLLLTLVKEDMCLLVVFFGIYLMIQKFFKEDSVFHFWEGFVLAGVGVFAFWLEIYVLIPFFKGGGHYSYWFYSDIGASPLQALANVFIHPLKVFGVLFANFKKIRTLFFMFGPFLFLPFFSPLLILTIPLIGEKMLSDDTSFWGFMFHFAAVLSPVLTMAAADGLSVISKWLSKNNPNVLFQNKIVPISAVILFLNIGGVAMFRPLKNLAYPSYYRFTESDLAGTRAIKTIPPEASVLAQDAIVPHLSHRQIINSLNQEAILNPVKDQFIIACPNINTWPLQPSDIEIFINESMKKGFRKVFDEKGWIVLERSA
jgi:uncharacterized membrane protein